MCSTVAHFKRCWLFDMPHRTFSHIWLPVNHSQIYMSLLHLGVYINLGSSKMKSLFLRHVTSASALLYQCRVIWSTHLTNSKCVEQLRKRWVERREHLNFLFSSFIKWTIVQLDFVSFNASYQKHKNGAKAHVLQVINFDFHSAWKKK